MLKYKEKLTQRKGLTDAEIEALANFDWDMSAGEDEAAEDEGDPDFVDEAIEAILVRGEEVEAEVIDNLLKDDENINCCDDEEVSTEDSFEKIDPSTLKWRRRDMLPGDVIWRRKAECNDVYEEKTPIEYFEQFFDEEVFELMTSQSNLYAMETLATELKCSPYEMRRYIGVLLYMGIIKIPRTRMIWSKEFKLNFISDGMTRSRFEKIKSSFHLNENSKQPKKDEPNFDKLYKIRPLLSLLKDNFNKIPQEEHQCVDEQIKAFKGRSSLKQYNPAKPHKWGMKMFTRAGASGIIYDFSLYVGDGTCPTYGLGISSDIVLYLSSTIPKHENYKLYFDNWFTSISLMVALKEMGIFATGTVRQNRMAKCELLSEAELKKRGRGSYDMKCEVTHNLSAIRWIDNKGVQLLSTYMSDQPLGSCKRWCGKEKKFIHISRPAIVNDYNQHMGGVDLSDMLMELYKINHRSKKWYMRIVYWCIGAAVVNAWLLYRVDLKAAKQKSKPMPLIYFQMEIAQSLLSASSSFDVTKRARGRPTTNPSHSQAPYTQQASPSTLPSSSSSVCSPSLKRKYTSDPAKTLRYDEKGHWVVWGQKGRCRLCKTGTPLSKCSKCGVYLCSNTSKNCFLLYHT